MRLADGYELSLFTTVLEPAIVAAGGWLTNVLNAARPAVALRGTTARLPVGGRSCLLFRRQAGIGQQRSDLLDRRWLDEVFVKACGLSTAAIILLAVAG